MNQSCRSAVGRVVGAGVVAAAAGMAWGQACTPWWAARFAPRDVTAYGYGWLPRVTGSIVFDDDGGGPRPPALYVMGNFTSILGINAHGVVRWEGMTPSALPDFGSAAAGAGAAAVFDPDGPGPLRPMLYAVGGVTGSTSDTMRWDGLSWSAAATNSLNGISHGPGYYEQRFATHIFTWDRDGAGPDPVGLYAAQRVELTSTWADDVWGRVYVLSGGAWIAVTPGGEAVTAFAVHDTDGSGPLPPSLFLTRYAFIHEFEPPSPPVTSISITRFDQAGATTISPADRGVYSALGAVDPDGAGPMGRSLFVGGDFPVEGVGEHVYMSMLSGTQLTGSQGDGPVTGMFEVDRDDAGPIPPVLIVAGTRPGTGSQGEAWLARFFDGIWAPLGPGFFSTSPSEPVRVETVFYHDDDGLGTRTSQLYAGGRFTQAGYAAARGIARWDGGFWVPPGPLLNNTVHALLDGGADGLYVGGAFSSADGERMLGIARCDGQRFWPLGLGMDNHVDALAHYGGAVVAAGKFTWANGVSAWRIARWVGLWQPLSTGMNGNVRALAVIEGGAALCAGGEFSQAGPGPALRVARWNGANWQPMGAGFNGTVNALAVLDGAVYAGGEFSASGSQATPHVARFDQPGSAWVDVGGGLEFVVTHLAVHRGKLYAGGVCGTYACVHEWDGSAWRALPPLLNGSLQVSLTALASVDGEEPGLYASGEFGGSRLVQWDGSAWVNVAGLLMDAPARAAAVGCEPPLIYFGGGFKSVPGGASWYLAGYDACPPPCYANCDDSTVPPVLNVNDFVCFQQRFAAGLYEANCDGSTAPPVLNVNDFVCFMGKYAAGCHGG